MSEGKHAQPIAKGTLGKTPFAHLLIYLDQHRLSGTLVIWPEVLEKREQGQQDRVLFQQGRPVAARLIEPADSLEKGLWPLFTREQSPYGFYAEDLVGKGPGRVDGSVDPLALVAQSLRGSTRDDVVDEVLQQLGDAKLRMQPKANLGRLGLEPKELALVELLQAEPTNVQSLIRCAYLPERQGRRLIYLLTVTKAIALYDDQSAENQSGPSTFRTGTPPRTTVRPAEHHSTIRSHPPSRDSSLIGMSVKISKGETAGADQLSTTLPPISRGPEPPRVNKNSSPPRSGRKTATIIDQLPLPPEGLPAELLERWREIVSLGKRIENMTYYEMLQVDTHTQPNEVKEAFFTFAKKWHPDRLPDALKPLKPLVETVFACVNEAHQCLIDEERKAHYARSVKEGGGTPAAERLMQQILDAAMAYQKVEVLVRKRDYDQALALLDRIVAMHNDEADYHAMNAWILLQKHPTKEAPLEEIIASAEAGMKIDPKHERANFCKGLALKRMGKEYEALRYFRAAAEINPGNVEAAREVHLFEMRKQREDKKTPSESGLLSKWFKKK
jgi:tetratricopeptide (TPR) repeat protein